MTHLSICCAKSLHSPSYTRSWKAHANKFLSKFLFYIIQYWPRIWEGRLTWLLVVSFFIRHSNGWQRRRTTSCAILEEQQKCTCENRTVLKWLLKIITWLQLLRWLISEKSRESWKPKWKKTYHNFVWVIFPTLWQSYMQLLGIVIGSSLCLLLLWLGKVMTVIWKPLCKIIDNRELKHEMFSSYE